MNFTFANNWLLGVAITVSVVNAILLLVISYKLIHIFQLGGYKLRPFINWLADLRIGFYVRLFALSVLSFGSIFIVNVIFDRWDDLIFISYVALVFYFIFSLVFCHNILRKKEKIKLRYTARVKRLFILLFAVFALMTYTILWVGHEPIGGFVRFSFIALIPVLLPPLLIITNLLMWPIEASIRQYYINKAKRKLFSKEFDNTIRIGITGSYAKTSCKNILGTMLSKKYKTVISPSSYNTPMGYARTINDVLKSGDEVIIFEMGLRYKRNIKQLARLFKPQHGILTGIGNQHIETMKTQEAIIAEKSELVKALPKDGIAVLNGESEGCVTIHNNLFLEGKILINVDTDNIIVQGIPSPYRAEKISVTKDGCEFDLILNTEHVRCKTILLGKHNIENILMCATMAHKLGVGAEQIAVAISELQPTPHRLQLIKGASGVIVLDDSYNASDQGTKAALDVLALFNGKKIVQTPGIIEQGKNQGQTNFKYARNIANVADEVIIINEVNREALVEGLKSQNFPIEKIHLVRNLDGAKELYSKLLSSGDVLLIANDLPDNFV